MICKTCKTNEVEHSEEGLCDECYHEYLDGCRAGEEWDTHYGTPDDEERENAS